jgi:hypothetical protein
VRLRLVYAPPRTSFCGQIAAPPAPETPVCSLWLDTSSPIPRLDPE